MTKFSKYVGLDTHKDTIAVAIAEAGQSKPRYYGEIANTPEAVAKLVKKLSPQGEVLSFCYEAGPCGYGIYRQLTHLGHDCVVVAPSLIPVKPGDRVKTDRRDSESLARLHRAGELTAVWVPGPEQEAVRDLTRAREDQNSSPPIRLTVSSSLAHSWSACPTLLKTRSPVSWPYVSFISLNLSMSININAKDHEWRSV